MKIEIEVPDEIELCGKIYVPTGEHRPPVVGERYYKLGSGSCLFRCSNPSDSSVLIYKEKRWRANPFDSYESVIVHSGETIISGEIETTHEIDDARWESGNYFKPGTAQKTRDAINAIFQARVANGE